MLLHWYTHTQPFNSPSSETTLVSQKKHSPTHTHEEEEEEGFAQTVRSALSQLGLLNPIKPAYNQSQPDGRLKLTASTFNRLWISMLAVLLYCYTELTASFISFSIIARHLLDFVVQGKITVSVTVGCPSILHLSVPSVNSSCGRQLCCRLRAFAADIDP